VNIPHARAFCTETTILARNQRIFGVRSSYCNAQTDDSGFLQSTVNHLAFFFVPFVKIFVNFVVEISYHKGHKGFHKEHKGKHQVIDG